MPTMMLAKITLNKNNAHEKLAKMLEGTLGIADHEAKIITESSKIYARIDKDVKDHAKQITQLADSEHVKKLQKLRRADLSVQRMAEALKWTKGWGDKYDTASATWPLRR